MKFVSKENLSYYTDKLKAWIKSRKIKASDLDSGNATAGQVATADGSGGVSFQDASGGSSHLYWHTIRAIRVSDGVSKFDAFFIILSQDGTALTKATLADAMDETAIYPCVSGGGMVQATYNFSQTYTYNFAPAFYAKKVKYGSNYYLVVYGIAGNSGHVLWSAEGVTAISLGETQFNNAELNITDTVNQIS